MPKLEFTDGSNIASGNSKRQGRSLLYGVVIAVALAVIIACITVIIVFVTKNDCLSDGVTATPESTPEGIIWPSTPAGREFRYATVATSEQQCATIGTDVLAEGGSAVDAAIAVSVCLGVRRTLSSGIGGGGFMTFYQKSTGTTYVLDYRETAPLAAYSTMYENTTRRSYIGGGSIGVPGELAGMWLAHQRFGKLPWKRLFQPSIDVAESGYELNTYIEGHLKSKYNDFNDELKAVFTDDVTGMMKKAGDIIKLPKLAQTLRRIADDGVDTFYNGTLLDDIMADLNEIDDVILSIDDFKKYQVTERQPIISTLKNGDYRVISPPPPSGGLALQYILNILDHFNFTPDSVSTRTEDIGKTATTYHRIIEAFKFSYAKRGSFGDESFEDMTQYKADLTDPAYCKITSDRIDDTTHNVSYYGLLTEGRLTTGTSQLSVIAGNGDAVSVTTTINYAWGSKRRGKRTGIIFNNEMDDFSKPGKPSWTDDAWTAPSNSANFIKPGKKPLSSMSPSIILDKDGNVKMVTGGSGGSKIITAAAFTAINNLWFKLPINDSVSRPRLHHQLLPKELLPESGFPQVYLDELVKKGHELKFGASLPVADSCGYDENRQVVIGVGDPRRQGGQDGF